MAHGEPQAEWRAPKGGYRQEVQAARKYHQACRGRRGQYCPDPREARGAAQGSLGEVSQQGDSQAEMANATDSRGSGSYGSKQGAY